MITPQQSAESLQVSTSTLRRWASEFEAFLSPRKGTKRLYLTSDLATFGRIKELYKQGLTTAMVKEALPIIQEQPSPNDKALITISDFSQALDYLYSNNAKVKAQLEEQAELIDKQRASLQAMQEQIDLLSMPWYKRILRQKSAPKS